MLQDIYVDDTIGDMIEAEIEIMTNARLSVR